MSAGPVRVRSLEGVTRPPGPLTRSWRAMRGRELETIVAAAAVVATGVWTLLVVGGASGVISRAAPFAYPLLAVGPGMAGLAVAFARPHSPAWLKLVLAWMVAVAVATKSVTVVDGNYAYALAPFGAVAAAWLATRWPVWTVVGYFAFSATYGSIDAFTPLPVGPTAYALLALTWAGLLWLWLSGRRPMPFWMPLALIPLGIYVAITALFVALSSDFTASFYSFRLSASYMTLTALVALLVPERDRYVSAQKAIFVVSAAVGAYAMLRWAIGPAGREADLVRKGGAYVVNNGDELRLFGAAADPVALGVWCATLLPFATATLIGSGRARWQLLILTVIGMCVAALAGSDNRTSMVATAAGLLVVLVLCASARSMGERKALPIAFTLIVLASGGAVFVVTRLNDTRAEGSRFRGLLDPTHDESVQGRLVKWRSILADMDTHPVGHGLGASGGAVVKYGRFASPASYSADSTYVKVAYDQGFLVALLFVVSLAALAVAMAQRGLRAADPANGALIIGGCGALVSFAVAMAGGVYFESLFAAAPWILVGLGIAAYNNDVGVGRRRRGAERAAFAGRG